MHVLAGTVLAPTLQTLLRGWLLGAAQWLRPAAREPLFAACLLHEVATLVPAAAACTGVLWWPHDDEATQRAVLGRADAVTVQGSDAAVAAVQVQVARLPGAPRCVGYGARWSGALVSAASQTTASGRARGGRGTLRPAGLFVADARVRREECRAGGLVRGVGGSAAGAGSALAARAVTRQIAWAVRHPGLPKARGHPESG